MSSPRSQSSDYGSYRAVLALWRALALSFKHSMDMDYIPSTYRQLLNLSLKRRLLRKGHAHRNAEPRGSAAVAAAASTTSTTAPRSAYHRRALPAPACTTLMPARSAPSSSRQRRALHAGATTTGPLIAPARILIRPSQRTVVSNRRIGSASSAVGATTSRRTACTAQSTRRRRDVCCARSTATGCMTALSCRTGPNSSSGTARIVVGCIGWPCVVTYSGIEESSRNGIRRSQ
ncbi:hypothetical protein C8Q72DRAFT_424526 [Fomitopsis betulina]|nr:hypothetical protein C8Q72DRAFT_424526 [Fomitopsis betulina]